MTSAWIAVVFAVFLWWFSTGAILCLVRAADQRGARARVVALVATLPLLLGGAWGFVETLGLSGTMAAYGAFVAAIAIWGWTEIAFLTGAITGPNATECPPNVPEWRRFMLAWGTIAYHELLLTMIFCAMWIFGAGAENVVGLWTFSVLYVARISAKLNLYLGVRKINTEFLPEVLGHLPSHFRIARLNWIFPISVTGLSLTAAILMDRLILADAQAVIVSYALLFAITMLALLEHWLMVMPLPDAKLWRWMLPTPKPTDLQKTPRPEGPDGF